MVDSKDILAILEEVCDPEIPVLTIKDLGILRGVDIDQHGKVTVHITPTYTGCPAMDMITVNVKAALQDHNINDVEVVLSLHPIWTTDWITDAGKKKLLAYGIAPPVELSSDPSFINGDQKIVPCPQCGSKHTALISLFGSTACKALYKCTDCLEPFDYFKCH